jgi:hypothetical protein
LSNKTADSIKDQLQPFMIVFDLARFQDPQVQQDGFSVNYFNKTISHYYGTRIDPQNYFVSLLHPALYFYKINEAHSIQQNLSALSAGPFVDGGALLDHLVAAR